MALDRFRCTTSSGADLCFNGGTCVFLPGDVQKCACPAGWGPDNVIFHNDNCALPDYALLGLFVANTVLSLVYLILLYRVRSRARNRAKRILNWANVAVILFAIEMLALWLENGWFTATSVIVCFVVFAFFGWGAELSEFVAVPIFGMNAEIKKSVQRFIKIGFTGLAMVNVVTTLALAVTAQFGPIPFNKAMIANAIAQFVSVLLFCSIILRYGNQLRKKIQQHDLEKKVELDAKLKNMVTGAASVVMGQLPGVVGCIIIWVIGSTPWYWVFLFVIFISTPYTIVNATLAIFNGTISQSSGQSEDRTNRPQSKDLAVSPQHSPRSGLSSKVLDSTLG